MANSNEDVSNVPVNEKAREISSKVILEIPELGIKAIQSVYGTSQVTYDPKISLIKPMVIYLPIHGKVIKDFSLNFTIEEFNIFLNTIINLNKNSKTKDNDKLDLTKDNF